jgi:hypothetical protein
MRKAKDITEDGVYLLRAGMFNTVWIMATRKNLETNETIHVWRDVQDWTGQGHKPEDLDAYDVVGKVRLQNPPTIESFVS